MSDLLVLLSTLGGLVLFGAVGFIIGPIVAALFVTVWDLYGATFQDVLPEVRPVLAGGPPGGVGLPEPEAPAASDRSNQERDGEGAQPFAPDQSAPEEG